MAVISRLALHAVRRWRHDRERRTRNDGRCIWGHRFQYGVMCTILRATIYVPMPRRSHSCSIWKTNAIGDTERAISLLVRK